MEKDKILQIRAQLLEQLKNDLIVDYFAAEYISEEESGIPCGEITVMFNSLGMNSNEAFGELFFAPDADEESSVSYFECVILISDSLENADMAALKAACAKHNLTSPAGFFFVDEEGNRLVFKLGIPFSKRFEEDVLFEEMNIAVGNALDIVDRAIDELLDIAEE